MNNITMASSSSSSSSLSLSSSSPTNKKTLFKKPNSSSSKATSLTKRRETVFKKAYELSILCGIEVCVIFYGPCGELKTWPKNLEKVKDMARRYSELSETKRRKGSVDLREFHDRINKDDSMDFSTNLINNNDSKKKKSKLGSNFKYPDWDPRFDSYYAEQLTELYQSLERNHARIQHRFRAVSEAHKQRNMQNTNMAAQTQRMTTPTMNHLQQHSNQVYHGNGTLSQFPVPASAFNQAQSLAPIPPELTIYPNFNVANYTGINEFQNANMYSCNNFNNCMTVEDYLRLLGVKGTEINGLQNMNMNMYGYQ